MGRIVAVDGAGRVKKHGPQVLLFDVADFGGVVPQAVHDELDVMAVQFQELGLDQLCRIIVPGHPDGLAVGADGFQQDVHDFVQLFPVYPGILGEDVILDVLQNQVPVDLIGRFFRLPVRSGGDAAVSSSSKGKGFGEWIGMESVFNPSFFCFL